ncbi:Protein GDAP2-like [Oopsacas minuta]|uniref:Protein GDAP2-like n=1 Tax=Oopsacas minuta TaxID=111878 RepID=A0AAV7K8D5_9METZ|nr:Protein GDAP2-like [Oopsacas minuta]
MATKKNLISREPQKSSMYKAGDLLSWGEMMLGEGKEQTSIDLNAQRNWEESPFIINKEINNTVVLWSGPVEEFECSAIVCPNLENLNSQSDVTRRIFKKAGADLCIELEQDGPEMKTSELRVTEAYRLPCRFVLHCIEPKFTVKFETAAETALFSCYHRILIESHARNLEILAIPSIHSVERGYPPEQGTHIALRTVRRYLERYPNSFQKIVFNIRPEDEVIYNTLMKAYFPRTQTELQLACYKVQKNIGNEKGEIIYEGREIRVMGDPLELLHSEQITQEDIEWYIKETSKTDKKPERVQIQNGENGDSKHNFATMHEDNDEVRQQALHARPEAEDNKKRYLIYLRHAKTESLSSVAQYDPIFKLGFSEKRMVLGYASKSIPGSKLDVSKAKLYFVKYMDSLVSQSYILVYFHTVSEENNYFSQNFFESLYNLCEEKYKQNLHALYIVHPYFWFKVQAYKFLYFIAYDIKERVWMINSLKELSQHLGTTQLNIPQFVLDYDNTKNGPFRKESQSRSRKRLTDKEDANL